MNQYYELMVEKGFHEDDTFGPDGTPDARTRIVFAGLITTEWREQRIDADSPRPVWWLDQNGKPCGELSEWADIWLRCADALGACREPLDGEEVNVEDDRALGGILCPDYVPWAVARAIESSRNGDRIQYAAVLRSIMRYSLIRMGQINLWCGGLTSPDPKRAIQLKHEYNATRTRRHGGKLA